MYLPTPRDRLQKLPVAGEILSGHFYLIFKVNVSPCPAANTKHGLSGSLALPEVTVGTAILRNGCFPPVLVGLVARVTGNTCPVGRDLPTVS